VSSSIVTDPAFAAGAWLIVYVPLDTNESAHPERYAIALIVVVADTAIGPAYCVPVVEVGTDPSVV
jgi:hypothetical protein